MFNYSRSVIRRQHTWRKFANEIVDRILEKKKSKISLAIFVEPVDRQIGSHLSFSNKTSIFERSRVFFRCYASMRVYAIFEMPISSRSRIVPLLVRLTITYENLASAKQIARAETWPRFRMRGALCKRL